MTMNPNMTIYLDIDGVVNVTATTEPELAGWSQQRDLFNGPHIGDEGRWLSYHPELVDRLNTLAQLEHVQIVLASAWRHDSRQLTLAGLQCQDWEYLYEYERAGGRRLRPEVLAQRELLGGEDWKMWAMAAHQKHVNPTGKDRFLFIEDTPHPETCQWVDSVPGGTYLSTDTALGITAEQMDAVEAACAPEAGQAELDRLKSLSMDTRVQTMHEIYWVRGSYRPSDEADLQRLTERGFRPGQPRDMEVYLAWKRDYEEKKAQFLAGHNLDGARTFHL